jgi:hypothetical protein
VRRRAFAIWLLVSAIVSAGEGRAQATSFVLEGDVPAGAGDYFTLPFDVPAGIEEIEVAHDDLSPQNILDWGVWSPDGFRGWGGGNDENAIIGRLASSRSYRIGPMTPGTWEIVVGKAKIVQAPGQYRVEVTLRETATLSPDGARAAYAPATLSPTARFYAGDFHVHSRESGDADASLDEIAALARERGLDFVVITDHNTDTHVDYLSSAQAEHDDVLFIPGCEFTTYGGHVGAAGALAYVDHRIGHEGRTLRDAFDTYGDAGVLLTVNHPVLDLGDLCIGCAWSHGDDALESAHAVEIVTGANALFLEDALAFWDSKLDRGFNLAAVGGSDDHRAGRDTGFAAARIGTPTTMVYASELSARGIIEGVRRGLTVVRRGGVLGPMIELAMDPPRTSDELEAESGADYTLPVRVTGASGFELRLIKNGFLDDDGTRTLESDDETLTFTITAVAGDRYRAEVWSDGVPQSITSHVVFVPIIGPEDCHCASTASHAPLGTLSGCGLFFVVVVRARRRGRA